MIRLIIILIFAATSVQAATYDYYFSNSGSGSTCSQALPCALLSDADTKVKDALQTDVVNLYFNRGDTWTWDSAAVSTVSYKIAFLSTDPETHIAAYGTGDKPIFDGLVTDFSTVPDHDATNGPVKWNRFFHFERENCSINNVEIKGMYGHGVYLNGANNFSLTYSLIHDVGSASLAYQSDTDLSGVVISYNTIHTAQQLFLNSKLGTAGWAGGIILGAVGSGVSGGHTISHNTIYDISGEGINIHNSIIEYNIIGDTCSVGLMAETHTNDAGTSRIRYNLVTFSDYATSLYTGCSWSGGNGKPEGIRVYDDSVGGDNSGADYEVHDNIIINRDVGFWFFSPEDPLNPWGSVKIYNNIVIDSVQENYRFYHAPQATDGYFYNNSSIFYDRSGVHIIDDGSYPNAGWTEYDNHYWNSGTVTVDPSWNTTYDITDPQLLATTGYIGNTSATYYKDIDPKTEINPPSGSPIYGLNSISVYDILDLGNEGGGTISTYVSTGALPIITNDDTSSVTYSYLGADVDTAPNGIWGSYGSSGSSRVYGRMIPASDHSGGTANAINIYQRTVTTSDNAYACLYKLASGSTYTLIGYSADIDGYNDDNAWTGWIDITAASGQSLDFLTTDQLLVGECINNAVGSSYLATDNGDSTVVQYLSSAWSGTPPTSQTVSTSSSTGLGVGLRIQ